MKFSITQDPSLKVSTVEFSWTDGEIGDLLFGPAEREILSRQVESPKEAAMVVLLIAQGLEDQIDREQRQFHSHSRRSCVLAFSNRERSGNTSD